MYGLKRAIITRSSTMAWASMIGQILPYAMQKQQSQEQGIQGMFGDFGNMMGNYFQSKYNIQGLKNLEAMEGQGIDTIKGYTQQSIAGLDPYRTSGNAAESQELSMLQQGRNPTQMVNQILGSFQQSPYQSAAMNAGLDAVRNKMIASGLGGSGAEEKALESYGQGQMSDMQNQYLQNILGARGQTLSGLGQLSGMGLNAAGTEGQIRGQAGQDIAGLLSSMGMAQQKEQQSRGSQKGSFWGGLGDIGSNFIQSIM